MFGFGKQTWPTKLRRGARAVSIAALIAVASALQARDASAQSERATITYVTRVRALQASGADVVTDKDVRASAEALLAPLRIDVRNAVLAHDIRKALQHVAVVSELAKAFGDTALQHQADSLGAVLKENLWQSSKDEASKMVREVLDLSAEELEARTTVLPDLELHLDSGATSYTFTISRGETMAYVSTRQGAEKGTFSSTTVDAAAQAVPGLSRSERTALVLLVSIDLKKRNLLRN